MPLQGAKGAVNLDIMGRTSAESNIWKGVMNFLFVRSPGSPRQPLGLPRGLPGKYHAEMARGVRYVATVASPARVADVRLGVGIPYRRGRWLNSPDR